MISTFKHLVGGHLQYSVIPRTLGLPVCIHRSITLPPIIANLDGTGRKQEWFMNNRQKLRYNLTGRKYDRTHLRRAGSLLLSRTVDGLPYVQFFDRCGLPDTFNSWFTITHIHVWMLMGRVMQEGKDGVLLRDEIITHLWSDMDARIKLIAGSKKRKEHMTHYSELFTANVLGLDEGLLGDDMSLASAIFRHLIVKEEHEIEFLVEYIRRQVFHLNHADSRLLLHFSQPCWNEPFIR